jgi:hypothetical protein
MPSGPDDFLSGQTRLPRAARTATRANTRDDGRTGNRSRRRASAQARTTDCDPAAGTKGLEGERSPWKNRTFTRGNKGGRYGLVGGARPWSRSSRHLRPGTAFPATGCGVGKEAAPRCGGKITSDRGVSMSGGNVPWWETTAAAEPHGRRQEAGAIRVRAGKPGPAQVVPSGAAALVSGEHGGPAFVLGRRHPSASKPGSTLSRKPGGQDRKVRNRPVAGNLGCRPNLGRFHGGGSPPAAPNATPRWRETGSDRPPRWSAHGNRG